MEKKINHKDTKTRRRARLTSQLGCLRIKSKNKNPFSKASQVAQCHELALVSSCLRGSIRIPKTSPSSKAVDQQKSLPGSSSPPPTSPSQARWTSRSCCVPPQLKHFPWPAQNQ